MVAGEICDDGQGDCKVNVDLDMVTIIIIIVIIIIILLSIVTIMILILLILLIHISIFFKYPMTSYLQLLVLQNGREELLLEMYSDMMDSMKAC